MEPKRDILHISLLDYGGAFVAAQNLVAQQNRSGISSRLVVLSTNENERSRFIYRIFSKIDYELAKPFNVSIFKSFAMRILLNNYRTEIKDARVVHLHWMPGLIPVAFFERLGKRKIVWTLHDMNAFTGVCHNAMSCSEFRKNCDDCPLLNRSLRWIPRLFLKRKKSINSKFEITYIAPSRWMESLVQISSVLEGSSKIKVVPNAIDLQAYKPVEIDSREEFFTVGILGSNYEKAKNAEFSFQIVEKLAQQSDKSITTITFGESFKSQTHSRNLFCVPIGSSTLQMNEGYRSCDVFLFLSRVESFGNMVAESLASGVPVILLNGTGASENVTDGETGFKVKEDQDSILLELRKLMNSPMAVEAMKINSRRLAEEKFNEQQSNRAYIDIYNL
jgi:glycosyltransferase involved in cell wall biosynthesis